MAITNHERVGKALELLKAGLGPFVEREFKAKFGDGWAFEVKDILSDTRLGGGKKESLEWMSPPCWWSWIANGTRCFARSSARPSAAW